MRPPPVIVAAFRCPHCDGAAGLLRDFGVDLLAAGWAPAPDGPVGWCECRADGLEPHPVPCCRHVAELMKAGAAQ